MEVFLIETEILLVGKERYREKGRDLSHRIMWKKNKEVQQKPFCCSNTMLDFLILLFVLDLEILHTVQSCLLDWRLVFERKQGKTNYVLSWKNRESLLVFLYEFIF